MLWGQTALKSTISHKLLKYPLVIVIVIVIVLFFILKIKLHNLLIIEGREADRGLDLYYKLFLRACVAGELPM